MRQERSLLGGYVEQRTKKEVRLKQVILKIVQLRSP